MTFFLKLFFQDLKRERAKAVLALNALEEKLEEKLKMELEQKVHIKLYTVRMEIDISVSDY